MDKNTKNPEAVKKSESKKTESEKVDIHCACAMGDLSEFAPVQPAKKTEIKKSEKILKKDDSKKENSNKK